MPDVHSAALDQVVGERLRQATSALARQGVTLQDVLDTLAPEQVGETEVPERLPLPAVITPAQKDALAKLPDVFGSVVPTERRTITPAEAEALMRERQTLDEVAKMIETRKDAIRTTIYNHLDVEVEQAAGPDEAALAQIRESTPRDPKGFYLTLGEIPVPEFGKVFKREVREGHASITEAALRALADDPDVPEIGHDDYLAMTTPTRVFDQAKAMLYIRKRPAVLRALLKAATPGKRTTSFNVRPAKGTKK